MTEDTKCRCGAYAKEGLHLRGSGVPCCSMCYEASWADVGDAEWSRSLNPSVFEEDW